VKRAISFTILLLILSAPAFAAKSPLDYRRTLIASAGQKKLALEAPMGMCFLDRTNFYEAAIFAGFRRVVERNDDQVLLAVFADCNDLASMKGSSGTHDIPLNAGIISWMNPSVGETTELSREEYLDMREASFRQYVENLPPARYAHLDAQPRRTENSVAMGFSRSIKIESGDALSDAVVATSSLRHIPIEVTIRSTGTSPLPLAQMHEQMDKFMAQQIALNE
jgi:hypothetical protein